MLKMEIIAKPVAEKRISVPKNTLKVTVEPDSEEP
jgi:hypothetical protein